MTTPATPMDTVTLERRIAARPETVFGFFTDRDEWLSWMGADGTFSFEPGGPYRTRVTGENVASGRFLTLDPPARLVFTWGWEGGTPMATGSTRVEITLEPTPTGTLLHLIHSGLPTSEACEAHAELWQHYIDRLAERAEGGTPTPDPWARPTATRLPPCP
ncbi:SRPBCC family protein [Streptomyces sp. NBC_01264]|uniref:SRPBCC family protein n=1 Tax=Streptomyces sp. NBC_01264 TaxID=2903804 RepID=UPI00224CE69F|nr:SRPBCC domain-containing protein [Streptomyces sp. NBC_01264]MCX4779988.1 SRPBCC domain-containing protein [Streptomyces sp. NBC_01264]